MTIAQQQVYEVGIVKQTIDLIEALVNDDSLSEARIDESFGRIQAFKASRPA